MNSEITPAGLAPAPASSFPTWAPAGKDAVGTSLGTSRVWFTVAQGIITEVYSPRPDIPQLKDMGFIVGDGADFWVELRHFGNHEIEWAADAIPAITITHRHPRFTLVLRVCVDPARDVLVTDFTLAGDQNLQLYVLAAPRIGEDARNNLAWADEWVGQPVLWAEQGPFGLALLAAGRDGGPGLLQRSVGCVGASDGWQDFNRNGGMRWHYAEAGPGEIALTAQLPRAGTLALGLSSSREAAATLAVESMAVGFEAIWAEFCLGWSKWLQNIEWPRELPHLLSPSQLTLLKRSAMVIRCHEDHTFPGAMVAGLAVPWGESSTSRGGYHLVWARDLVEAAGALVAMGCLADARRVLAYLSATQQADGHWLQNQWLGGKPFWQGIQLDETAFPVLLAGALAERNALNGMQVDDMVRRALAFIVREGPVTGQDRWEEDRGVNTFTVAVAIAALVEGSRFLGEQEACCALMVADFWNASLEEWTWVKGTGLARTLGVAGYHMRSAPEDVLIHDGLHNEALLIKNRAGNPAVAADEQLATDCLQLLRFGLRDPADPQTASSVRAVDAALRVQTPSGAAWHRYNGDGYGEHEDGSPFDGSGVGRAWPLLTGERGHVALLAGESVQPYLQAMVQMTGKGGLLPEQVWDSKPMPERQLFPGQPTGSAMPLVWAHAEFIKLALSLVAGFPVDRPARCWTRYGGRRPILNYGLWRMKQRIRSLVVGRELRLLLDEPAQIHWGTGNWHDIRDVATQSWGLGHVARISVGSLQVGQRIVFTIYWRERACWQGEDFAINIVQEGEP